MVAFQNHQMSKTVKIHLKADPLKCVAYLKRALHYSGEPLHTSLCFNQVL